MFEHLPQARFELPHVGWYLALLLGLASIIIDPDNYVLFGDVKPGATPAETLRELVADMAVTRSKTVV